MTRRGWWMLLWVAACTSLPTEPGLADRLVGSWRWVDATGGIAGVTRTPASEGKSMTLRFVDHRDVERLDGGAVVVRTGYVLTRANDASETVIEYETPLFGFASQRVTLQAGDTLSLVDPCCDGFAYRFVPEGG